MPPYSNGKNPITPRSAGLAEGNGLTVLIYELTEKLPSRENYRLIPQMTRSVISVPANIAEGHARPTARDYAYFLAVAKGSLMETETFVMLVVRLKYGTQAAVQPVLDLITEISKMLTALRDRLLDNSS